MDFYAVMLDKAAELVVHELGSTNDLEGVFIKKQLHKIKIFSMIIRVFHFQFNFPS